MEHLVLSTFHHTLGNDIGLTELLHLPLPDLVKEEIATKINLGIRKERIIDDIHEGVRDRTKRNEFHQTVARKHG